MKIVQSLKQKNISSECIAQALSAIDEDEYKQGLKDLLRQKRKSVSGKNQYERNAKLIRFAVGKGFLIEEVLCFVKQEDWNEYMD
jgi:regulatory protein